MAQFEEKIGPVFQHCRRLQSTTAVSYGIMDGSNPENLYTILNVPNDASIAAIRRAHRKLVFLYHPDRASDKYTKDRNTKQFQQVQRAYEVLSDEPRRQYYDKKLNLAEIKTGMDTEVGALSSLTVQDSVATTNESLLQPEMQDSTIHETGQATDSQVKKSDWSSTVHTPHYYLPQQPMYTEGGYQSSYGYQTPRPPSTPSIDRCSSCVSSDSGYFTRNPSNVGPVQHQSSLSQKYGPSIQQNTHLYDDQKGPHIELGDAFSMSPKKHKEKHTLR